MWILPPELGPIALPEGVLLLPYHYGAEDRERLLALLGVALPGCPQLVVEGAALEGLIARRLEWAGGIVLVHGLAAETEVDGLRELVAPLGAKHALVQLPQPQVAGTSWMESLLKVPLLRALERAWKNPAHPLRAIGIHECPLREAAQYTDEPVELLAIVTAMVEHRMAHAGVGVGKGDWERSLDQALAARLRARLPVSAGEAVSGHPEGGPEPSPGTTQELEQRGLGIGAGEHFRFGPLHAALARPTVRAYATPLSQPLRWVDAAGAGAGRLGEFHHMSLELWPADDFVSFELSLPQPLFRSIGFPVEGLSLGMYQPHIVMELADGRREQFGSAITALQRAVTSAKGARRTALSAQHVLVGGIACEGPDAPASLAQALSNLLALRVRAGWWPEAVSALAKTWALRAWIQRKSRADVREVVRRLKELKASLSELALQDRLRATVRSILSADRFRSRSSPESDADMGSPHHGAFTGAPDKPGFAWEYLRDGDVHRVVQLAASLGTRSGGRMTIEHLHGDLAAGVAALVVGDVDAATTRARTVLDLATRYEIPVLRAFARELLAAVHELRGEYDVAAKLLFQARARYIALEDTSRILGVEQRLTRMGITFDPAGTPRRKRPPRSR
ncbi:MAG: hypothetical protein Q8S73_17215 [Deltaproteobacteria bacterium]|nr:hypothetical protein [Myxococcales bacterium]MDP3215850.1 hypothetical protein [Deltaproteobacteria bacterium]